jgi:hypothetical protein
VKTRRYTAKIAGGVTIAENVTYDDLATRVLDFILHAAIALSIDSFEWEHEKLRREGLQGIEFFVGERALWLDRESFDVEKENAKKSGYQTQFLSTNEFVDDFLTNLDSDLRERLARAGYAAPSLISDMKKLYREISDDVKDRSAQAQQALVTEILQS